MGRTCRAGEEGGHVGQGRMERRGRNDGRVHLV